ncbi:phospholipase D family protein [Comamonas composti]|uniref:phospholipase D family protein n=1 Tax=Comamonas composti TaxID=408558 RepID=UPI001FDEB007|nr:phospholipase D family protein [Comamonas composti]
MALLLAGCASQLPVHVERPVSTALAQPQDTALGQLIERQRPARVKPQASAFHLLAGAQSAYGARLALAESAQHTLDLQYYAIHADQSSQRLLRSLVSAARRGVRVRVLLDDFHSTGADAQVMRLAFVPGIEMRMFNPLAGARSSPLGRAYTVLTDFQRAQQRMHNKLFAADNVMAVVGGRNLGDAYFDADINGNFVDLDVLAAGPVVKELSRSFDSYWNNARAYPVQSLIGLDELRQLRARYAQDDEQTSQELSDAARAQPAPGIWDQRPLKLDATPWVWASAVVLADRPAKIASEHEDALEQPPPAHPAPQSQGQNLRLREQSAPALQAATVVDGLLALVRSARRELLVVSPYFVPGPDMMQAFAEARSRGVSVRVLTNSLASNDAPLAHAGYARHRKQLLEMGVELHELLSQPANLRSALRAGRSAWGSSGTSGASRAMLHTKLLVIDNHLVVIGSMNLDLRSQLQNTELALLIASRSLAGLATHSIDASLAYGSWHLQLGPEQQLTWRAPRDSERDDEHSEPDASWGLRLLLRLIGPLAPDELL